MNEVKISIIVPVYNVEKYLSKCLDSLINQTLKEIEIICINDGSTDGSGEILENYAKHDPRIKIINQENKHAGVARNIGLKIAKGKYIHFLDADDWVDYDTYQELYEIIKNSSADLVKFKTYSYDDKTKEIATNPYLDIQWVNKKYINNHLTIYNDTQDIVKLPDAPWTGIYNNNFLKKHDIFFDDLICANDIGFFYRCIINAERVYLSSKRFVYYRQNVKTSLISKRAKNFDCQIALYDIVKNISKNLPDEIRNIITNQIIETIFNWYKKCFDDYNISINVQRKMNKEMQAFIKRISNQNLTPTNIEKLNKLQKILFKNKLQKIFSIQNFGINKIFCLMGVEFKIANPKYQKTNLMEEFRKCLN